jgi:3-hydroxyisobutyrate dehydrogenase
MNPTARIAFLGLGIMGSGMARRVAGAGFPLTVYNRHPERAAAFTQFGARTAATPREAAVDADIIISMVADDAASRSVWLGEEGALSGTGAGSVLIESSTVSPAWIQELAAAAASRGCELLDAPVTGSKNQAASGELTFLVGGPAGALEKARPALAAMSRAIVPLGQTGNGALLKLINNFICGVQAASLAEGLALIEKSGLNRDQAVEFLKNAAPGSPLVKTLADRMTASDFTPNFLLKLMAKDLGYADEEGKRHGLDLTTAANALAVFKRAMSLGHGDKDMAAIIEPLR